MEEFMQSFEVPLLVSENNRREHIVMLQSIAHSTVIFVNLPGESPNFLYQNNHHQHGILIF
jgi:hypothetical protein